MYIYFEGDNSLSSKHIIMKRYNYKDKKTGKKVQSDKLLDEDKYELIGYFLKKPLTRYCTK